MLHERQRLLDVEIGVILLVVAGGADALDDAEGALVGNAVDGGLLEGGRRLHVVVARPVADLALHVGHRVALRRRRDRKSTRLNSSHRTISYAVFCLKKKTTVAQSFARRAYHSLLLSPL